MRIASLKGNEKSCGTSRKGGGGGHSRKNPIKFAICHNFARLVRPPKEADPPEGVH